MRQPQPSLTANPAPSLKATLYIHTLGLLSHFVPQPPTPTQADEDTHGKEEVKDTN